MLGARKMDRSRGQSRCARPLANALWVISLVVNHLVAPYLGLPADQVIQRPLIADMLAVGSLALSLVVYRLAPRAASIGSRLYTVAIAYEVALAFAVGVLNQWQPQVLAGRLSWLCVLILIFPSIVPSPPRKVLLGSLLTASMDPVGLPIAQARPRSPTPTCESRRPPSFSRSLLRFERMPSHVSS